MPPKICRHAPVTVLQQARRQGLGLQEVPGCQLPAQVAWKVMVQMMEPFRQQTPSGGQGLVGVQLVPGKPMELEGQSVPKLTSEHAPVAVLQQTRTQGLGVQESPVVHWPLQAD